MAFGDIVPLNPQDILIEHFPVNASETFDIGEFVQLNADGEVAEAADEGDEESVLGVSAGSGDTTATASSATGIGIFRYTRLGDFVPGDNAAVTGDLVPVYLFSDARGKYATRNFATDGAGTDVAPTTALAVGETGEKFVVAGVHGVDVGGATTDEIFLVTNVLDTNMIPIELSGATGVWVVFRSTGSSLNRHDVA